MQQQTLSLLDRVKTKAYLVTPGPPSKRQVQLLQKLQTLIRLSLPTRSCRKVSIKHSRLITKIPKTSYNQQFKRKKMTFPFQMTVHITRLEVMAVPDRSLPTVVDLIKITRREQRVRKTTLKITGKKRMTGIAFIGVL